MTHPIDSNWLNPEIAQARHVALDALKLSASQLQQGMELHARATVVESYGFSAAASPDPRLLQAANEQHLHASHLRKIYVDSLMTRMARDPHQRKYFEEAWRAAGVTCVIRNSGEEGNVIERLIERLAHNTFVTDRLDGFMARATTAADIRAAKRNDHHCFIFTTNGVPLTMAQQDAHEELRHIQIFRQLGVRMMHLTYNRRNPLGDGCGESQDGGLSDLGRAAIAEMNRHGVIVDGAHSSLRTCLDAAKCSSKPIMISHTTCAALNAHCRAKTDDVLRAVAENGGVVGIAAVPAFLGGRGDIVTFLDHIDHAIRIAGEDHVSIGTDVATIAPPSPEDGPAISLPINARHFESHWPANDALFDARWSAPNMVQSLAWTNWPLFTAGLLQRGHGEKTILKIIGENVLRVLDACDDAK